MADDKIFDVLFPCTGDSARSIVAEAIPARERRDRFRAWSARSPTDTFSGIMPPHAPGFILAQLVGAAAAALVFRWLLREG